MLLEIHRKFYYLISFSALLQTFNMSVGLEGMTQ